MKKFVLTIAVVLGMTIGASAQYFGGDNGQPYGGGLFGYGLTRDAEQGMEIVTANQANQANLHFAKISVIRGQ